MKTQIIFRQINDPQSVARLAKAARKTFIENKKTAEKMKKTQLQQKQQLRERISTTTITTSDKVTTCPRCSSTNAQISKYCNNCGFRFADVAKKALLKDSKDIQETDRLLAELEALEWLQAQIVVFSLKDNSEVV